MKASSQSEGFSIQFGLAVASELNMGSMVGQSQGVISGHWESVILFLELSLDAGTSLRFDEGL